MEVTLDGERLTAAEIAAAARGVRRPSPRPRPLGRGRSRQARRSCSTSFERSSRRRPKAASRFAEAMRLLAGANVSGDGVADAAAATGRASSPVRGWPTTLDGLRRPEALARVDPGDELKATLRPYQQVGVRWLHLLSHARPRRLPGRRHGPRQDDAGAGAAAGAEERARWPNGGRACSSRRRRSSRTGRRRSSASRRACGRSSRIRRRCRPPSCRRSIADSWRTSTSSSRATDRCCALPALVEDAVATGRARRGAGDQESRRQADARGQAARRARADRADRHAGREPARRPLVDLRLHQPGPARLQRRSSRASPSASPSDRTIRTGRCASWCGRTSCAG